jgi:magnesium transporter
MPETAAEPLASIVAVEFDFQAKTERAIPLERVVESCAGGRFCWIDVDALADPGGAEAVLRSLGVNEYAIAEAMGPDADGRHDLYDDCLHIAVTSAAFRDGKFGHSHVDIVIGERFLVALRRGRVEFIDQVRRHYRKDFEKFAQTPSFLLYEYIDHLIDGYRKAIRSAGEHVQRMQSRIFGIVSDEIFNEVSDVTRDILSFRKVMLAVREVLHELATRRTAFVSASSQPFLDSMAGTLERLSSDLSVERDILSETLNLYMGIVAHRTNKVVTRLTVLSAIFLPLTFLCGVYGTNFEVLPETKWTYGYAMFWGLVIVIATSLLILTKRKHWW